MLIKGDKDSLVCILNPANKLFRVEQDTKGSFCMSLIADFAEIKRRK